MEALPWAKCDRISSFAQLLKVNCKIATAPLLGVLTHASGFPSIHKCFDNLFTRLSKQATSLYINEKEKMRSANESVSI